MSCQNCLTHLQEKQAANSGIPVLVTSPALYHPGRTAMARKVESLVARTLVQDGYLSSATKVLDWGCGQGQDVRYYQQQGFTAFGFDPNHGQNHSPEIFKNEHISVVTCSYVLNVVTEPLRKKILQEIADFLPPHGQAFLAVRSAKEIETAKKNNWHPYEDGYLTSRQTFQKGFTAVELVALAQPYFGAVEIIKEDPLIIKVSKEEKK